MDQLHLSLSGPLSGEVYVSGAKNAVTKLMVAAMLADSPSRLTNVPDITEVSVVADMLRDLGASVERDGDTMTLNPTLSATRVSQRYGGVNRIPILLLGVLCARFGAASVPLAGGCAIGARSIDFHTDGMKALGASVLSDPAMISVSAPGGFVGTRVRLPFPSVGATENLMLAATLAHGTTVIENAATEPEIVDLALFLQKMGALILMDADRRIVVEGVARLAGCDHDVVPDRVEAASYALAAMATGGSVFLRGARQEHMMTFLNVARRMGASLRVDAGGLEIGCQAPLRPVHIESDVHPGFATDWVQPLVAVLPLADGMSVVHETVYERRLSFTCALAEAGARIETMNVCLGGRTCRFAHRDFPHSVVVAPGRYLRPLRLTIPDLRGGFAYVIAALCAPGESVLGGLEYLDRGYENVAGKLAGLGAAVSRRPCAVPQDPAR